LKHYESYFLVYWKLDQHLDTKFNLFTSVYVCSKQKFLNFVWTIQNFKQSSLKQDFYEIQKYFVFSSFGGQSFEFNPEHFNLRPSLHPILHPQADELQSVENTRLSYKLIGYNFILYMDDG
jgi:hypothetical protein